MPSSSLPKDGHTVVKAWPRPVEQWRPRCWAADLHDDVNNAHAHPTQFRKDQGPGQTKRIAEIARRLLSAMASSMAFWGTLSYDMGLQLRPSAKPSRTILRFGFLNACDRTWAGMQH